MTAFLKITHNIERMCGIAGRTKTPVQLVAVSKTQDETKIRPLLEAGHSVFGENKVQEAQSKWPALQETFPNVKLHLIGPLQRNKAGDAVALFDVIETLDRESLAKELVKEIIKQKKNPKIFVQVNTGGEPQKAGILPQECKEFIDICREKYGLEISGLMCIPPVDELAAPHFAFLAKLAKQVGVQQLSMGMSADYEQAIMLGATHVRVGRALFGERG